MGLQRWIGARIDRWRAARYDSWTPDGDGFARGGDIYGAGVRRCHIERGITLDELRHFRRLFYDGAWDIDGWRITGFSVLLADVVIRDGRRTPLYDFVLTGMRIDGGPAPDPPLVFDVIGKG